MVMWQFLFTIFVTITASWWAISTAELKGTHQSENNVTVTGPDPAYFMDKRQLDEAVTCPVSVSQARETVLLVHGTGVTWVYL